MKKTRVTNIDVMKHFDMQTVRKKGKLAYNELTTRYETFQVEGEDYAEYMIVELSPGSAGIYQLRELSEQFPFMPYDRHKDKETGEVFGRVANPQDEYYLEGWNEFCNPWFDQACEHLTKMLKKDIEVLPEFLDWQISYGQNNCGDFGIVLQVAKDGTSEQLDHIGTWIHLE